MLSLYDYNHMSLTHGFPFTDRFAFAGRRLNLPAGSPVFRQGDHTAGFFGVRKGTVELIRTTENGGLVVLHRAGPGENFAEASLFADRYHCDAIATSACDLIFFPKKEVLAALKEDDGAATALLVNLSSQVQRYRLLLQLCSIRRADERVLAAMEAGLVPDSWKSFAPQIGLSPEAVYRALSSLAKRGVINKTERGKYSVHPR